MTDQPIPTGNPYALLKLNYTWFYGWKYILQLALRAIGEYFQVALELIGLPGTGKTALLRHLAVPGMLAGMFEPDPEFGPYPNYYRPPFNQRPELLFPVLVEFKSRPSSERPMVYIARRLQEAYAVYRSTFPEEKRPDRLPQSLAVDEAGDITMQVLGHLTELNQFQVRAVFLFDDFELVFRDPQDAPGPTFSPDEIARMGNLWRQYASFILSTDRRLKELHPYGSTLLGATNPQRLRALPTHEALRLVNGPLKRREQTGAPSVEFPEADLIRILNFSGKFPYLLIVAASQLWEIREQFGLLDRPNQPLTESQASLLAERLNAAYERLFKSYWDAISAEEQQVLKGLTLQQRYPLPDSRIDSLLEKGLIVPPQDYSTSTDEDSRVPRYELFSELFAHFVNAQEVPGFEPPAVPSLSENESKLYNYLLARQGQVVPIEELWQAVWGPVTPDLDQKTINHRVQVLVNRIKPKLLALGQPQIKNVRGRGYQLSETASENEQA